MKFLTKNVSGRFTIPSGIVGTEVSVLKRLSRIKEVGVLTTKSISLEKREGNREPIIAQLEPGTFINAVGLANPGAEEFRRRLDDWQVPEDKFLLVSIVGKNDDEFVKVAEILKDKADGFEINVSCPHGGNMGQIIGSDFEMVEKIIKRISEFGKPVVVKISPNLDVDKSVAAAVNGGAVGIAAINTVGPFESNILSFGKGGMSGKKVLEKGVSAISEVKKLVQDKLVIIASGGISTAVDAKKYLEAGADILSVGSVLAGMTTDEIEEYFKRLENDINEGTDRAAELIKNNLNMEYQDMEVEENVKFTDDLCWLKFNKPLTAEPGQFVMFFMPGCGEKPFSFYNKSGENLEILCSRRGCLTEKMFELKPGDKVKMRGPYGVPMNIAKDKKILFVAGGTGIAASKAFFETYDNFVLMVGARSGCRLSGIDKWQGKGKIMCYTDDGTLGTQGVATNDVKKIVDEFKPDYILACGPEIMNQSLISKLSDDNLKKTYLMRENETKCGIGICGRCADKDGNRYCVDGYKAEKE